jgi:peptide/nickel transport system permease protein
MKGGSAYVLRRSGFFLFTLWIAVTLNFLIPRLMPGNPAQLILEKFGQNEVIPPAQIRAIEAMLGIPTTPLWQQYLSYLRDLVEGRWGISYSFYPYSVTYVIGQALPWTLALLGTTTVITFVLGNLLGALAAWRRNSTFDALVTITANFTGTFPYFWTAMMLLYLLAIRAHWFPATGGYAESLTPSLSWTFLSSAIDHSILPALTIVVTGTGGWLFGMRNNMINILGEDYVRLAVAKGLPSRRIALHYGARNAILPNLAAFAISVGGLVGGSILVETTFNYPGMGYLLFNAVNNQDYPLMQAIFLLITVATLLANYLADLLNGILDPRVRTGGEVR